MISTAELKEYLNISSTSTALDSELASIINQATARIEAMCSRVIESKSIEEWQSGDGNSYMYVDNPAISAITKIEVLSETDYTLSDLAASSDVYLTGDKFSRLIRLKNNLTFTAGYKNIKIAYTAGYKRQTGTGTISISQGGTAVTGVNSLFNTELAAGDRILSEGQAFIIATITDNTHCTVTTAADAAISGKSYSITDMPEDLRTAAFMLAGWLYYQSNYEGNAKQRLGITGTSITGEINTNETYSEPNIDKLIQKYKLILL